MDSAQAIRQAEQGDLEPFYLVVGEELFLARAALNALRKAALAGGIEGLNDDQLDAAECSVEQALAAARTLPMMAPRRFVLVRHIERWEGKEGQGKHPAPLDRLLDYASAAAESTVFVAAAQKLDKRRRLYTFAKKQGCLVTCDPLSQHELPRWIRTRAQALGHTLEPAVAELIAELSGPELSQVDDALERLSLYVGPKNPLTEDAVGECLVRVRPTAVWELVGAVADGDTGRALGALAQVFEPQDRGLRLLGLLAWQTRQLLKFESALRSGLSAQDSAKNAGAPPFKARELSRQVKRIPRARLESWLPALARVDLALKGGSDRPAKAILEHAVIELCRA